MPNTHHKLRDYQLGVLELLWQDSLATGLSKFEARRACGTGPSHSGYSEHIWLLSTERQGTVRSINSMANFWLCITGLLRGKHIQRPFWAKPFQEIVDPSKHQDCRRHIALIEIRVTQHLLPTFCYSLKQKRRGVLSKFNLYPAICTSALSPMCNPIEAMRNTSPAWRRGFGCLPKDKQFPCQTPTTNCETINSEY